MTIKVTAIGGYGEIGRNMTLITVDNESIICDMGVHLDRLINFTQDEDMGKLQPKVLIEHGIIPDDTIIKNKDQVVAIIPSHGHLDHIASLPFLSRNYKCPIICTPYTAEVVYRQFKDNDFRITNKIRKVNMNSKIKVGKNFEVEFISITHSIPHAAMLFIHTKYGTAVYANDFKIDRHPTLSQPPNFKQIANASKNVKVLITECLRAHHAGQTASESVAVQMLEDILISADASKNCIFVTTFASHVERLHSIVAIAKKLRRKVIFMGRSLEKYGTAAKNANVSRLIDSVELIPFRNLVRKRIQRLNSQDRSKYLVVMTGHQGEKQAVLYNMLNGKLPSPFKKDDIFVFSCNIIPTPAIQESRAIVEEKIEHLGLRLFKDVHVSGHASREDLREILRIIKPQNVIPSHGTLQMMRAYQELAEQEGYVKDKNIHFLMTGDSHEYE